MNLLADECVAAEVIARLRADGHAVEAAGDAAPGASDDDVLARAAGSGRVLVTADKDFGELVYRLGRAHAGVVLLRLAGMSPEDRAEIISAVFRDRAAELPGSFAVVEPDTVRIRRRLNADPGAVPDPARNIGSGGS
jgi:predicted nuclease of predicted toxin-antitoxin system